MSKKNKSKQRLCAMPEMQPLPNDAESICSAFDFYLTHHLGRFLGCRKVYLYQALAATIRDHLMADWRNSWQAFTRKGTRRACYMSLEFLMGRALGNHMLNLGIRSQTEKAMMDLSLELEGIEAEELDAGLGNDGLGRLAAHWGWLPGGRSRSLAAGWISLGN